MSEKLCLVTGTTSGIGRAVAEVLLERGWEVLGIARREAPLAHPEYRHARVDLADTAALEARLDGDLGRELRLSERSRLGLVNNAAVVSPVGPLRRLPGAELARALAVNVVAPACLLGFLLRPAGRARLRVVDVSSGAATRPYAAWSAYCSSKAALRMLGMVAGEEAESFPPGGAAPLDFALASYEPGVVDTAMQASVRSASPEDFPAVKRFVDLHANGLLHRPEEPAREIAALLERDDLPRFSEHRLGR
ncbi:MAG TPA: SDR family NAD(P)-dependent oxidoreductase [Anaeromyxobacteraceae bacterium]|nr:SDR family NAD(P)-dependent oxidoreductase [Anaeromyxobacteraceae bacterium]